MFIFLSFVLFVLTTLFCYKISKWKYRYLPSPGLCLPIIGHSYMLMNRTVRKDLVNGIWDIFRKYQRNGILYINTYSINCVWIGDFHTLRYVFNLSEVQNRQLSDKFKKMAMQTRKVRGDVMPGILHSQGKVWSEQRRFALRTLKDFGFGKQGLFLSTVFVFY